MAERVSLKPRRSVFSVSTKKSGSKVFVAKAINSIRLWSLFFTTWSLLKPFSRQNLPSSGSAMVKSATTGSWVSSSKMLGYFF